MISLRVVQRLNAGYGFSSNTIQTTPNNQTIIPANPAVVGSSFITWNTQGTIQGTIS